VPNSRAGPFLLSHRPDPHLLLQVPTIIGAFCRAYGAVVARYIPDR
jgi:hypothetical protein